MDNTEQAQNREIGEMIPAQRNLRNGLVRDLHRPLYHIVAPEGVCRPFDPNGAIWWKGRYHLFYIFQNEELPHGGDSWGHISSSDLVHWRHHPTALAPAIGDPEKGIYSGCALLSKDGTPTIVYLGVDAGICIARASDDNLDVWTKEPSNPVIPIPREGDEDFGKYVVHDPHVWLENGAYYAIINGWAQWDTAYLFRSTDLLHWEYQRRFYEPRAECTDKDEDFACPDFFPLVDRHMLLCISHKRGCRYYLGSYDNGVFHPEQHARLNWDGGPCFAPESLLAPDGRRVFWAWALDRRPDEEAKSTGWSGCMTLPRVLSLSDAGTLMIDPPQEIELLRGALTEVRSLELRDRTVVDGVSGDSLELDIEVDLQGAAGLIVRVRESRDGSESTAVGYDATSQELFVDVTRSTQDANVKYPSLCWNPVSSWYQSDSDPGATVQRAPLALETGEPLKLRIFVDRSIVEVFANSRQCITHRTYPTKIDAKGVALESLGSPLLVTRLSAWPMAPSNAW